MIIQPWIIEEEPAEERPVLRIPLDEEREYKEKEEKKSNRGVIHIELFEDDDEPIRYWVKNHFTKSQRGGVYDTCMDHFASILISEALKITGGNRSDAAKLLGISRPTLHSKLEKYDLRIEVSVNKV